MIANCFSQGMGEAIFVFVFIVPVICGCLCKFSLCRGGWLGGGIDFVCGCGMPRNLMKGRSRGVLPGWGGGVSMWLRR